MTGFMDKNFLLNGTLAQRLFFEHGADQPIFDCHNHLAPGDIAEHRSFSNLTELWLEADHYKWRAMRACGVEEKYITGDTDDFEKFKSWAYTLPRLIGNPLYHWTHLELQRYFGINKLLCPATAEEIWEESREIMRGGCFDTVSLLKKMNVRTLCTTDDPADDLKWHKMIAEDRRIDFKVLPSFRPDKYLTGNKENDRRLCLRYGASDIFEALFKALDFFQENGCIISDHSFGRFIYGKDSTVTQRMDFLGNEYAKRGICMQLHLGAVRNNSARLFNKLGPDAGGDSIGWTCEPEVLGSFLYKLEENGSLPKTILYDLNPSDNGVLSTMAVNFAPQVQFGAAWWFNDTIRGIKNQLTELMETGALTKSIGMLTDSRSFTSFPRHEYFRRILCRLLAEQVENGLYPEDEKFLGQIVEDICYNNAKDFFSAI